MLTSHEIQLFQRESKTGSICPVLVSPKTKSQKGIGLGIAINGTSPETPPKPPLNFFTIPDPFEEGTNYQIVRKRRISYISKITHNFFVKSFLPIFIPYPVTGITCFDGKLAVLVDKNFLRIYDTKTAVLSFPEIALCHDVRFIGSINNIYLAVITNKDIKIWSSKLNTIFSHSFPYQKNVSQITATTEFPNNIFSPVIHFTDNQIIRFSISRDQWVAIGPQSYACESIIEIRSALNQSALLYDTRQFHFFYKNLFLAYLAVMPSNAVDMVRLLLKLVHVQNTYIGVNIRELIDELIESGPEVYTHLVKEYDEAFDHYLGYSNETAEHIRTMNTNMYYFRKFQKHGPLPKIILPLAEDRVQCKPFMCPRFIQDKGKLNAQQKLYYKRYKEICKTQLRTELSLSDVLIFSAFTDYKQKQRQPKASPVSLPLQPILQGNQIPQMPVFQAGLMQVPLNMQQQQQYGMQMVPYHAMPPPIQQNVPIMVQQGIQQQFALQGPNAAIIQQQACLQQAMREYYAMNQMQVPMNYQQVQNTGFHQPMVPLGPPMFLQQPMFPPGNQHIPPLPEIRTVLQHPEQSTRQIYPNLNFNTFPSPTEKIGKQRRQRKKQQPLPPPPPPPPPPLPPPKSPKDEIVHSPNPDQEDMSGPSVFSCAPDLPLPEIDLDFQENPASKVNQLLTEQQRADFMTAITELTDTTEVKPNEISATSNPQVPLSPQSVPAQKLPRKGKKTAAAQKQVDKSKTMKSSKLESPSDKLTIERKTRRSGTEKQTKTVRRWDISDDDYDDNSDVGATRITIRKRKVPQKPQDRFDYEELIATPKGLPELGLFCTSFSDRVTRIDEDEPESESEPEHEPIQLAAPKPIYHETKAISFLDKHEFDILVDDPIIIPLMDRVKVLSENFTPEQKRPVQFPHQTQSAKIEVSHPPRVSPRLQQLKGLDEDQIAQSHQTKAERPQPPKEAKVPRQRPTPRHQKHPKKYELGRKCVHTQKQPIIQLSERVLRHTKEAEQIQNPENSPPKL